MARVPIAITAAACVLPRAHSLSAFEALVLDGTDAVGEPIDGRFGIPNAAVLGEGRDRAWSLAGGYVEGFETDFSGLSIDSPATLDPQVHWLLHASRLALGGHSGIRSGAVFGNLSFPTEGMGRWGEGHATGHDGGDPRNHFMSGLPAALVAQALGLDAGATCVDAACASSLYAIKLACDALEAGRADRMLAGAVQRADPLFLHIGFCQLGAMSKTGRSRPFHAEADGLVPAEGCVVFGLRRLDDALHDGEAILGVIRGIGLSNDGRGRSLLAPSSEGQVRAMRLALHDAGWTPDRVQLFECHATGTPTGDRTELDSLAAVYPGGAIGSLKSNFGHLITAAGAAGLLKVLTGMKHGVMPRTLHLDHPLDGLGNFELLAAARPWPVDAEGQRRAAVSAFGFGGNNGHLLVEGPPLETWHRAPRAATARGRARPPLAVLALVEERQPKEAVVSIEGLRFPPADIAASLGQQGLTLEAARVAWSQSGLTPERSRVGVYVGMGCDGSIFRWGLRWRLPLFDDTYHDVSSDEVAPPLRAEHVVGTMPNIVANRVGVQIDAAGPGFTVSAEEVSGLRALDAAWDAITRGEIDAAVVAAVDVATDPRALAARRALGQTAEMANGVVALVVVAASAAPDARVVAWLDDETEGPVTRPHAPAHGAAEALITLADAIHRGGASVVQVKALGGQRARVGVRAGRRRPEPRSTSPRGPVVRIPLQAELPAPRSRASGALATTTPPVASPSATSLPLASPPARSAPSPLPAPSPMNATRLPPAPSLVPVALSGGPRSAPIAVPVAAPSAPSADAAPASPPDAGHLGAYTAWRGSVSEAHAAFLHQQSSLHTAFLDQHTRMTAQLLALSGGGAALPPSDPDVAAPAVPPIPSVPPSASVPAAPSAESFSPFFLSRAELEMGAVGSISTIFGTEFAELDGYERVVRMPAPPLLLADRVIALEGPRRVLGKGRIITETDIKADSWYLHDGRMPGGLMIESGQADLLLGSWQGIDWLNQSERIYRLLGCTLTYLGELPKVGETLRYDIRIDQHAKLGDVRMFFFRYDCHVGGAHRLRVQEGQAGFFTDEELKNSGGCLWDAAEADPGPGRVDPPVAIPTRTDLDRKALEQFAAGNLESAFGPAFARAHSHTWTPRVPGDRMLILDRAHIELEGGPWKRGYLRAELDIRPDLWFFSGHFHNDPCMPGTLMFDGCLQAMYLFLAARGHTLHRDGWRFEPAKDIPFKLRCRGQVIPSSTRLTYEIFVSEVVDGPTPRMTAQVLCTVDGLKCFHADPLVVELVPDWPLARPAFAPQLEAGATDAPVAAYGAWSNLLACAWGRPSDAFGPMYRDFDGVRRVPRLPGPPYHFMSRVIQTTGEMGSKAAGIAATVEYDVPPDAWYFAANAHPVMPWAVLLEAALQPCGWLASWSGCAVGPDDFLFRNLDGSATIHREITPQTGRITTTTKLERVSKSGGMILVSFTVNVVCAEGPVVDMKTVFGFFPPEAFVNQVGVGSSDVERARLTARGEPVVIPGPESSPSLATGRLLILDRAARLADGSYRGEKDVSPKDWFFAAHFYQDPVQPGSLGIEALLQLLQVAMADRGLSTRFSRPRFEPTACGETQTWKYRGQVVPENKLIQSDLRITEVREEEGGTLAIAEGSLWVDGKRIYAMPRFAMRIVEDQRPRTVTLPCPSDHRPTWTLASAPMMTMALTALAEAGKGALIDGEAKRWLTFPGDAPREVAVQQAGDEMVLGDPAAPFFRCRVAETVDIPGVPELLGPGGPLRDGAELYASGELFHGPGFHAVERMLTCGSNGCSGLLKAGLAPDVLLDGMTHLVPHDDMQRWFPTVAAGMAAYPARLRTLVLSGPLPTGPSVVEVRALRLEKGRPVIGAWLRAVDTTDTYHAFFELEEVLLPKGPIGSADPSARRAFLQKRYTDTVSLSRIEGGTATLSVSDLRLSDWLPGTVAAVYGSGDPGVVAAKEIAGRELKEHPAHVEVAGELAWSQHRPLRSVAVAIRQAPQGAVQATAGNANARDLSRVVAWWRAHANAGEWAGEGVLAALAEAWLADFVVHDPEALAAIEGPVLFLGNHESYLESVIFSAVAAQVFDRPLRALAKVEHQTRWLGNLHALLTSYPGRLQSPQIAWFDQARPQSLRPTLEAIPGAVSLLVHVEGSRQTIVGEPVAKISSIWTDYALERGLPIVPVAFRGGVNGAKTDVPVAPQTHHVGSPIHPEALRAMPYAARRQAIADAINALPSGAAPTAADVAVTFPGRAILDCVERLAPGCVASADPTWARRFRAIAE